VVVLTQFRFGWYPLGLAKARRAAGESISLCLPDVGWTEDFGEDDWARSRFTWARGYHGVYAHLSRDSGESFAETSKIDCAPHRDGYSRTPVIEIADRRVAYALTEHHPPHNRFTYLVTSVDDGRTWSAPHVMLDDPERLFSEPDIAEVAAGEIYCVLRGGRSSLHGMRSRDGGLTWSSPEATSMEGLPGHLLVLGDGRSLCAYGRRTAPFGIRFSLSEDGGRTWGSECVVRDDLPNADLGYPTTIEYAPGELFVCYYGQTPDGVTCVQGTYVTL
jgi:Neuraminidase (sialidase)